MSDNKAQTSEPEVNWEEMRPQIIKLVLELGPLVVFFIANAKGDDVLAANATLSGWFGGQAIILATAVFMAAMALSLLLSWLLLKKIAIMPLVTGIVVMVFGGLTLWLRDDTFIKMKPTITDLLFAGTLLGGLLFKQSLLKYVFGDVYKLQPRGWYLLTLRWGLFFLALAIANEVVWRGANVWMPNDPKGATDLWVSFKVWGVMPLTILFSLSQLPTLSKYAPPAEPPHVPPIIIEG